MSKKNNKEFSYSFYVNGQIVDRLTEEQKESMAKKLSSVMSRYYTLHHEEFVQLKTR